MRKTAKGDDIIQGDVVITDLNETKHRLLYHNILVGGAFDCSNLNYLISLDGSPKSVGTTFDCSNSGIKSLKGCPRDVGGNFFFSRTSVRTLHNIHKMIDRIGGYIYLSGKVRYNILGILKIRDVKFIGSKDVPSSTGLIAAVLIMNKYIVLHPNPLDRDIHGCQEELIESGLADYAGL